MHLQFAHSLRALLIRRKPVRPAFSVAFSQQLNTFEALSICPFRSLSSCKCKLKGPVGAYGMRCHASAYAQPAGLDGCGVFVRPHRDGSNGIASRRAWRSLTVKRVGFILPNAAQPQAWIGLKRLFSRKPQDIAPPHHSWSPMR